MTVREVASVRNVRRRGAGRIMLTFRLLPGLVAYLRSEAPRRGLDVTAFVTRLLEGFRTYCGLPAAAVALLEADRAGLGMDRYEYIEHVLFQRSLEVREKGTRFDAPRPLHGASGSAGRP